MGDTSADEVKKWDSYTSLEGNKKPTAAKGEYNCFTITPFHLYFICNAPFHHISISPCKHGCVFCATFHHIRFTIALYQSISPSQHFTMWTWVFILCAIFSYLFCHNFLTIHFIIPPFHHYSTISQKIDVNKRHLSRNPLDYLAPMVQMKVIVRNT